MHYLLASIEFDETFPLQNEEVDFERTFSYQLNYPDVCIFGYQTQSVLNVCQGPLKLNEKAIKKYSMNSKTARLKVFHDL